MKYLAKHNVLFSNNVQSNIQLIGLMAVCSEHIIYQSLLIYYIFTFPYGRYRVLNICCKYKDRK
jgi:hypothetical protein